MQLDFIKTIKYRDKEIRFYEIENVVYFCPADICAAADISLNGCQFNKAPAWSKIEVVNSTCSNDDFSEWFILNFKNYGDGKLIIFPSDFEW